MATAGHVDGAEESDAKMKTIRIFSLLTLFALTGCASSKTKTSPPQPPASTQPDLPPGYCTQHEYKNCPPK
jgi:hypothetical protein